MTDESRTTEPAVSTSDARNQGRILLMHLSADVAVAMVWAALIVAIVLFSGVVSQFAYVDF